MTIRANHYDVLIVGDGLSGIIAGALLAAKRYRVGLLKNVNIPLSNGEHIKIRQRKKLFWEGVFEAPIAASVISELALSHVLRTTLKPQRLVFQLLSDDIRVDVPAGIENLPGDCKREIPESEGLNQLFQRIEQIATATNKAINPQADLIAHSFWHGFKARKNQKELARALGEISKQAAQIEPETSQPPTKAMLACPAQFFNSSIFEPSNPIHLRTIYQVFDQNLYVAEGQSISAFFIERMQKRGGVVHEEEVAINLERSGKGFKITDPVLGEVSADVCVINTPIQAAPLLLPEKLRSKFENKILSKLEPKWMRYHATFHVAKRAVPDGLWYQAIYVRDFSEPSPEQTFMIVVDPNSLAETSNRAAVTVVSHVPVAGMNKDTLKRAFTDSVEFLKWLFPFVERHIAGQYEQRVWLPEQTGLPMPVANTQFVYEHTSGNFLPEFKHPRIGKNLYVSAPEQFLFLGNEAPFAAGQNLYKLIEKRHKLQVPE